MGGRLADERMPDCLSRRTREMLGLVVPFLSPASRGRLKKDVQFWLCVIDSQWVSTGRFPTDLEGGVAIEDRPLYASFTQIAKSAHGEVYN